MKYKLIDDDSQKTFALVFDAGDEVLRVLTDFAKEHHLSASQFTAIGAFDKATLGFFDFSIKDYKKIAVKEQVEVLVLAGDIAMQMGTPKIHAHVVLGKSDGSTMGGHLLEARVHPTLEVILIESPVHLHREIEKTTGLPLIQID